MKPCHLSFKYYAINVYKHTVRRFEPQCPTSRSQAHTCLVIWLCFSLFPCMSGSRIPPLSTGNQQRPLLLKTQNWSQTFHEVKSSKRLSLQQQHILKLIRKTQVCFVNVGLCGITGVPFNGAMNSYAIPRPAYKKGSVGRYLGEKGSPWAKASLDWIALTLWHCKY